MSSLARTSLPSCAWLIARSASWLLSDALQRLICDRMRELHYSYGDVARLGRLPRSTVHHLATHGRSGRLPHP
ncbi:MAG TPA: hypothetical protein VH307_15965, partial [Streptosporangiaceae bacterium]|nr:hypothetical protein [Streptosporangiaceae bacterium]